MTIIIIINEKLLLVANSPMSSNLHVLVIFSQRICPPPPLGVRFDELCVSVKEAKCEFHLSTRHLHDFGNAFPICLQLEFAKYLPTMSCIRTVRHTLFKYKGEYW